jgi:nicotinamidase-related amidase
VYRVYPEKSALVIIDIQEKLMKVMSDRDQVVRNTLILLELANQFQLPVIVTEQYPKGLGPTVPEIAAQLKGNRLIEKITYSACPELADEVKETGRSQVIVVGSETHICVLQTVRDLLASGFAVQVPCDAVCSRRTLNQENGLSLMREMGAVITNTETVVFDMLKRAGTKEFKVMSPLVK